MEELEESPTCTYEEYLSEAERMRADHPNWRVGQAYFNALSLCHPLLSRKACNYKILDPFYDDRYLPIMLGWAKDCWKDGGAPQF